MDQYQNISFNEEDEGEISLRDMLYYILRQWRKILVCAICFCALLGGFTLVKGFNELKSGDLSENQEAYESELEEYTINKKRLQDQIKVLTKSIQDKGEYYDQSVLMNLNSNAAYRSTLTYIVNATKDDALVEKDKSLHTVINRRMNSVLGAYASLIQNGTILSEIEAKSDLDLNQQQLAELVYVQTDYQAKLLHVTIVGGNEKQVQVILDAVQDELQNAGLHIASPAAYCQLELVSSYVGEDAGSLIPIGTVPEDGTNGNDAIYQTSIDILQKDYVQAVADMQEKLFTCKDQLKELEEPVAPAGISKSSVIKESIKFALLGVVAGAFLMALFYAMQYIFSGKLMTCDYLNDNYGLMVMADYHAPVRKHPDSIDQLIARMNGITEEKQSLECVYALGAANIAAQMKNNASKILLSGNAKASDFDDAATALKEKLQVTGLEVVSAGNINENVVAVQKMQDADKVVLIEQFGVSRLQDIKKELQMLRKLEKDILGVIVL